MNMKKIIVSLLLVALLLACLPVSAAERKLTCDAMYQVSDTQIVIEFSEPVAINLNGNNYGPYVALRLVTSTGGTTRITNLKSGNYGQYLQWNGTLQYLDSKHDRLIWTFTQAGYIGCSSITDVRNRVGELSESAYDKYVLALVMEEIPFIEPGTDLGVCNITTEDGKVALTPTKPTGWEKVVMEPVVNYSYPVYKNKIENIPRGNSGFTFEYEGGSVINPGELNPLSEELETSAKQVVKNDPVILAAILGGSVLLSAALIVVGIVIRKKRKVA